MWQLRRIRLESAGVSDARFAPLELELTDEHGQPTDTVLWLENGGGKSSMLGLVMSVLRPALREFLGQLKTDNHLYEYVRAEDTAHIILEWSRPSRQRRLEGDDTELLITGQVLEWRDRRADHEQASDKLQRAFYAFRATDGLTLDTLPVTGEDGRTPLTSYIEQLRELMNTCKPIDRFITRNQGDWMQWLSDTAQLDPEVFRYQVEMNADEGAIDEAFEKLDSEDAFVRWTLDVVTDDTFPRQLANQLNSIRRRLEEQPLLELEASFCAQAAGLLEEAADAHDLAVDIRKDLAAQVRDAVDLIGKLNAAAERAANEESRQRDEARHQQSAADNASKADGRLRRQANTAERLEVELRVSEARTRKEEVEAHRDQARTELYAWEASDLLVDRDRRAADVRRLEAELAKARADLQPLLDELEGTRDRLAAKLVDLKNRADEAGRTAVSVAEDAEEQARQRKQDAEGHAGDALTANATMARLTDRLSQLDDRVAQLRERGLIEPDENAIDAYERVKARADELDDRRRKLRQRRSAVRSERDGILEQQRQAESARSDLIATVERAKDALERFRAELAEVANLPALRQAADSGDDPVETDLLLARPDTLTRRLDDLQTSAQEEETGHRVEIEQDETFIDAVETNGRLPASSDVKAALYQLRKHGLPAVSGWQHLAEAVADDRRAHLVRSHPHVAGGIVVQDEERFDEAERILEGFAPTSGPITVTVRDAFDQPTFDGTPAFVVAAPAGLYDRTAAYKEADERREDLDRRRARVAELAAQQRTLHEGLSELRRLTDRYDQLTESRLTEQHRDATLNRDRHDQHLAELQTSYDQAEQAVRSVDEEITTLDDDISDLNRMVNELQPLVTQERERAQWDRDLTDATEQFEEAKLLAAAAREDQARLRDGASEQRRHAERHKNEVGRHTERLREAGLLGHDVAGVDVPEETVEVLLHAHRQAQQAYDRERSDTAVEDQLDRVHGELDAVALELENYDDLVQQRARRLLADIGVDNATERAERRHETAEKLKGRERELWQAEETVKAAEQHLQEFQASARARDRGPLDVQTPETSEQARQLREELTAQAEEQRRLRGEAERARDAATHRAESAKRRAQQFDRDVNRLRDESLQEPARLLGMTIEIPEDASPFEGDGDEAADTVQKTALSLMQLAGDLSEAYKTQQSAEQEVVDLAKDRRFDALAEHTTRENLVSRLSDATSLAAEARRLADELHDRKLTIDRDLEEIVRHRQHLVEMLGAAADHALGLLAAITRTKLPSEGLEDWSGKPFLKITHDSLPEDPTVVNTRLQELLTRLIDGRVSEKSEEDLGRRLVFEATKAAVGGSFRVSILKPRAKQLRYEPVPVTHLTKFSGGQRVTAAIVIFATLVSMRARAAGHTGQARSVLILDNPVGKASADTFVNLQRMVAAKTGVQLLFATGVNDLGALGQFTRILRLDGKENLRTGDVHLVAGEQFTSLHAVGLTQRAAGQPDGPEGDDAGDVLADG